MAENEMALTPKQHMAAGSAAIRELKTIVRNRPDKLVVGGKQYLYFTDYQMLGAFFGITPYITSTEEIISEEPSQQGDYTIKRIIGYKARAVARQDGKEISAAEAICLMDEPNWNKKPRFQVLSMAETRAMAKALRSVLSWIVKLPDGMDNGVPQFTEETVEERPPE